MKRRRRGTRRDCLGGGGLVTFYVFLDKTLEMVQFGTPIIWFSNEINPKVRNATSYEFSAHNTDFWEEYGLLLCPVLIRILLLKIVIK